MSLRTSIQRQRMSAKGGGGILPAGYVECEYLEATGGQYIDTNIMVDIYTDELYLRAQHNTNTSVWHYIATSGNVLTKQFGVLTNTRYTYPGCYNGGIATGVGVAFNAAFEAMCDYYVSRTKVTANNLYDPTRDREVTGSGTNFTVTETLKFFGRDTSGVVDIMIWSARLVRNGEDILNFIPCLDNNGRPCMYDTVSKQPFYNQGIGEFSYKLK